VKIISYRSLLPRVTMYADQQQTASSVSARTSPTTPQTQPCLESVTNDSGSADDCANKKDLPWKRRGVSESPCDDSDAEEPSCKVTPTQATFIYLREEFELFVGADGVHRARRRPPNATPASSDIPLDSDQFSRLLQLAFLKVTGDIVGAKQIQGMAQVCAAEADLDLRLEEVPADAFDDPVFRLIAERVGKESSFNQTSEKLFNETRSAFERYGGIAYFGRGIPRGPSAFGRHLKRLRPVFHAAGIEQTDEKVETGRKYNFKWLEPTPVEDSASTNDADGPDGPAGPRTVD
jgi:hypothetical protein